MDDIADLSAGSFEVKPADERAVGAGLDDQGAPDGERADEPVVGTAAEQQSIEEAPELLWAVGAMPEKLRMRLQIAGHVIDPKNRHGTSHQALAITGSECSMLDRGARAGLQYRLVPSKAHLIVLLWHTRDTTSSLDCSCASLGGMFGSIALTPLGVNVHQVGPGIALAGMRVLVLLPVMWRPLNGGWSIRPGQPARLLPPFVRS